MRPLNTDPSNFAEKSQTMPAVVLTIVIAAHRIVPTQQSDHDLTAIKRQDVRASGPSIRSFVVFSRGKRRSFLVRTIRFRTAVEQQQPPQNRTLLLIAARSNARRYTPPVQKLRKRIPPPARASVDPAGIAERGTTRGAKSQKYPMRAIFRLIYHSVLISRVKASF